MLRQQNFFANDVVVAALPIRLLSDSLIGVLTAISDRNDGLFSSPAGDVTEEGVKLLEDLADKVEEDLDMRGLAWIS